MSARLRTRRGQRHQAFAQKYGCNCRRHEGLGAFAVAVERMAADLNAATQHDQHELRAVDGGRR